MCVFFLFCIFLIISAYRSELGKLLSLLHAVATARVGVAGSMAGRVEPRLECRGEGEGRYGRHGGQLPEESVVAGAALEGAAVHEGEAREAEEEIHRKGPQRQAPPQPWHRGRVRGAARRDGEAEQPQPEAALAEVCWVGNRAQRASC